LTLNPFGYIITLYTDKTGVEMTEKSAIFVFIIGLLITLGGVGGFENSMETTAMLDSLVVSIVGLAIMYCGALGLRNSNLY